MKNIAPKESEKIILNRILLYLKTHGVFAWRENSGIAEMHGHQYRMGYPGIADIMGILPSGVLLAIEVKTKIGKQNYNQIEFQRNIEANKGVYILARSREDVSDTLSSLLN